LKLTSIFQHTQQVALAAYLLLALSCG